MIFQLSAMVCFLCSAVFHLGNCHSQAWCTYLQRVDYAGITTLIYGSAVPIMYYGFMCRPTTLVVWMVIITAVAACNLTAMLTLKVYTESTPLAYKLRSGGFCCLAALECVALTYSVATAPVGLWGGAWPWFLATMCGYLTGATLYAFNFPECLEPGRFDLALNSHNWMHVFVILAACCHAKGVGELFSARAGIQCLG